MSKHKRLIILLNKEEVICNEKELDKYVLSLKTNTVSWFNSKKEVFEYIEKELKNKRKIFITMGYKNPGCYEVWYNEKK